ncbi:MAG: glucose 1-dehydrogenase [Actinomycetota bacterium]
MGRLSGKVALITGAARGQGAAFARRFVAEGAEVVLADLMDEDGKLLADELGEKARYVHHDVTSEASWDDAVQATTGAFGKLNVLINNAGILKWSPMHRVTLEDYMAVITVNQVGCFLGMKAAIRPMREADGGSIINQSSTSGLEGMAGVISYSASKFAVRGMTKTAALELGRFGIRVNAVCPGGIDTQMGNPFDQKGEELQKNYEMNPIPRIGSPEEVAGLMVFLASDESSFCTGADFVVDGGYTVGKNPMYSK